MSDRNYAGFAGNPTGELFYTAPDGTVTQLRKAGDLSPITYTLGELIPPAGYNDTLKFSGCVNLTVSVGRIVGGSEDCIDFNHCQNVAVNASSLSSGGTYVSTIKASQGIDVFFGEITKHGSVTDFDLGNWSDQSSAKTTGVFLHDYGHNPDVQVRVLNADRPKADGSFVVTRPWWASFFIPVMGVLKGLHLA